MEMGEEAMEHGERTQKCKGAGYSGSRWASNNKQASTKSSVAPVILRRIMGLDSGTSSSNSSSRSSKSQALRLSLVLRTHELSNLPSTFDYPSQDLLSKEEEAEEEEEEEEDEDEEEQEEKRTRRRTRGRKDGRRRRRTVQLVVSLDRSYAEHVCECFIKRCTHKAEELSLSRTALRTYEDIPQALTRRFYTKPDDLQTYKSHKER
uniref:Uncharacterized protein n=1 Tax=Vespula pensylvanica TaxID=30213 RepID=A0A834PB07_VESPE|nr:hypothetical protein H0235_002978 [Vespula pensylvanica]